MGIFSPFRMKHMATPPNPAAGESLLYPKSDNSWWTKDANGIEQTVGGLVGYVPVTTHAGALNAGWSGTIKYHKYGNVVTVEIAVSKTSWGLNDIIDSVALPLVVRPSGDLKIGGGINGAVDNAVRDWWIGNDGFIRAATAGTGSIYGTLTYQVPSVERSTATNSGASTTVITPGTGVTIGAGTEAFLRGGVVEVNLNLNLPGSLAAGSTLCTLPEGFRPPVTWWEDAMIVSSVETMYRVEILTTGVVRLQGPNGPTGVPILRDSITFPAALSAAGLGTLLDTGWLTYASDFPNVSHTAVYSKYRRVGNTATTKQLITLSSTFAGDAFITLPFAFASDTPIDLNFNIGRVRGIRSGVAFHDAVITPDLLSGRASIWQPTGNGSRWTGTFPATWQAGDKWMVDTEYEAAPL